MYKYTCISTCILESFNLFWIHCIYLKAYVAAGDMPVKGAWLYTCMYFWRKMVHQASVFINTLFQLNTVKLTESTIFLFLH